LFTFLVVAVVVAKADVVEVVVVAGDVAVVVCVVVFVAESVRRIEKESVVEKER